MRVLVTGSDGFVGTWMVRHLEDIGDTAMALDPAIDIVDADRLTEAVVDADCDAIVNLAGLASVGRSWEDPNSYFAVNATGVLHLVGAARACARPPRVLLVGSAEVYGRVEPADLPLVEDRSLAPVSPYAMSKAAAEVVGRQAVVGHGLEVVIARPFNHIGPGQSEAFVVPSIARQVLEAARTGAPSLLVGDVSVRRDLTDVRDVVRAYRQLLDSGRPGATYNICTGESVEIAEVARRLLTLAGVDLPLEVDPARLRPVDLPDLRGDPGRLRDATGWAPKFSLDETLGDVLTSLQAP